MVNNYKGNGDQSPLRYANSTEQPPGDAELEGKPSDRRHTVGGGEIDNV